MRALHINGMTPPALAIAITLEEKGLDYDIVSRDWRETADALGDYGGQLEIGNGLEGEFPILIDDGATLSDSGFVLEYLDDRYPEPALKPDDAHGQWRVQALGRFLGERAMPAVASLGTAARFEGDASALATAEALTHERRVAWAAPGEKPDLADAHRNAAALLDRVEGLAVEEGEWLLGARYTLTDIAAFVLVNALRDLDGTALGRHPAAAAWADRVAARPAVAAALGRAPLAYLPGPELSRWG